MAEVATADNVNEQEVDLTHLVADLKRRVTAQQPMTEAKTDYDQLCKSQNETRGYNKKAMNFLTGLQKASIEKFEDVIGTLEPALQILIEHRRSQEPGLPMGEVKQFEKP